MTNDETAIESPEERDESHNGAPLEERLATLEKELAAAKDQLLRTFAEMENLRRRTEREIADTRSYAIAGFARDMLSVGDNLARALAALPPEAREGMKTEIAALLEGVEMTERELVHTLEKHGVHKLIPLGEKFDPHFHQAMFEVTEGDGPNGTVIEVVQSGYKIGERVLRPALVGVKRDAPKPLTAVSGAESGAALNKMV